MKFLREILKEIKKVLNRYWIVFLKKWKWIWIKEDDWRMNNDGFEGVLFSFF